MDPCPRWKIRRVCPILLRSEARNFTTPFYRRRAQKRKDERHNVSRFDPKMSSVNVCCVEQDQDCQQKKKETNRPLFKQFSVWLCKAQEVYFRLFAGGPITFQCPLEHIRRAVIQLAGSEKRADRMAVGADGAFFLFKAVCFGYSIHMLSSPATIASCGVIRISPTSTSGRPKKRSKQGFE